MPPKPYNNNFCCISGRVFYEISIFFTELVSCVASAALCKTRMEDQRGDTQKSSAPVANNKSVDDTLSLSEYMARKSLILSMPQTETVSLSVMHLGCSSPTKIHGYTSWYCYFLFICS
jgi:hypothetical protein